jgi:hypothetical protein
LDRTSKRVLAAQALGEEAVWTPSANKDGYHLDSQGKVVYSDAERSRKMRDHLHRCGIPESFFGMTIDDFWDSVDARGDKLSENDSLRKSFAKKVVEAYASKIVEIAAGFPLRVEGKKRVREVKSLLLDGGNSSGKTLLAAFICMEAAKRGLVVRFYRFNELVFTVSDQYENREEQRETANAFRRCDLLVIDGIAPRTDDEGKAVKLALPVKEGLERLSTIRADSGKPTILTCAEGMNFPISHPIEPLASQCERIKLPGGIRS